MAHLEIAGGPPQGTAPAAVERPGDWRHTGRNRRIARLADAVARGDLPPLQGSLKQVGWAGRIRVAMLRLLEDEPVAAPRLLTITDATWLVAHRDDTAVERLAALPSPARTLSTASRTRTLVG